jgi:hypothetical protein
LQIETLFKIFLVINGLFLIYRMAFDIMIHRRKVLRYEQQIEALEKHAGQLKLTIKNLTGGK